jgi:parallel beta-helix repeat protein
MKNYYFLKIAMIVAFFTLLPTSLKAADENVPVGGDIQNAIDIVADSGGGIVTLAKGTHMVTVPLRMKSNVTLQGEGYRESLIKTNDHIQVIIADSEGLVNLVIQNLAIEGINSVTGGGIQITSQEEDHNSIKLLNVHCYNTGWGVHIKGVKNLIVEDCLFEGNGAITKEGYAHNMYLRRVYGAKVSNSEFINSITGNGINISYSENIEVYNCNMSGNYFRGVRAADSDGFLVHDCIVTNNGNAGIIANTEKVATKNIDIKRNCVSNNALDGIRAVNSATGIVYDNNSYGNGTDYNLPNAVLQSGNITDNTINCVYNDTVSLGLSAVPGDDMIYLDWGYKNMVPVRQDVFRDTDSDPSGRKLIAGKVEGVNYTDMDAEYGVTYWYWIKASDESGSINSNAATTTAVNVDGLITLTALKEDSKVTLNWQMEGITLGNQEVYRNTDSDASTRSLIASNVEGETYTDETVVNGTEYWYWIVATDVSGESTESNLVNIIPAIPDPMVTLNAYPANNAVLLKWELKDITLGDQDVFRDTDSDPSGRTLIANNVSGNSYTDNTAVNDTEYWYWIKATDTSGMSTSSESANTTPIFMEPTITLTTEAGSEFVTLNWDIKDINVQNIGIFRDTDSNASGRKLVANGVTGGTFTDNSVENETEYWYWIKVTDVTGANINTDGIYALPSVTLSVADDIKANNTLRFYPNPVKDKVTLNMPQSEFNRFTVFDVNGRITSSGSIPKGLIEYDIDMSYLSKGIYMISVQGNQNSKVLKVVKN